jgi:hypothetical protein
MNKQQKELDAFKRKMIEEAKKRGTNIVIRPKSKRTA